MVRTQIRLTEEQASKIKRIAGARGVSIAEVIRDAVNQVINPACEAGSEDRRTRALKIVGMFRSGKKDVSEKHDQYLVNSTSKCTTQDLIKSRP